MFESVYKTLEGIGYTHPLHPPMVHLPVGLILGAFLFLLLAQLFGRPGLAQTARHCLVLALVSLIPAILLGLMDWQHRLGGTMQFPIVMKLILAGALLVLICLSILIARQAQRRSIKRIGVYALCALIVACIGYFGGELVYGKKRAKIKAEAGVVEEGATLALSAAMPGMVGSTLRKGGVFAGMRSQISHVTGQPAHHDRQIRIKLKLFNLIAKEMGPAFLQKGVYLEGKPFHDFLQRNAEALKSECLAISLNDAKTDVAGLLETNWENTEIFLQVTPEQKS